MEIKISDAALPDIRSLDPRDQRRFLTGVQRLQETDSNDGDRHAVDENTFVLKEKGLNIYYLQREDANEIVVVAVESKKSADRRRRNWVRERIKTT